MRCLWLLSCGCAVTTETVDPTIPKIFTIWPLQKQFANPCPSTYLSHYIVIIHCACLLHKTLGSLFIVLGTQEVLPWHVKHKLAYIDMKDHVHGNNSSIG